MFPRLLRLLLLLPVIAIASGCATSESDLGYKPGGDVDKPGDNSYHGWNDANR